ncbi:hypothetical protein H4R26_001830 [Coemansia thaxteri]|uniref:SH3 domain-containing protein n=1 Tax=Coemansia thaxteri TaxID=2663907 RepID=A0A9W8BJZ4_9FUNG|nr:hypothetical protein H4R26_001830 [Coemansia thaxteri]
MRARAIYACVAENPGEVTFDADTCLLSVADSSEDGWLVGTVEATGDRGLFPVVYTELTPESGDDILFLRKLQSSGLLSSTLQLNQFARDLDNRQQPPSSTARSRTMGTAMTAPPPPVPTKPLTLGTPRPARPLAPKPNLVSSSTSAAESLREREAEAARAWELAHLSKQSSASSSALNQPPQLPLKPINADSSDPELRRQKEREAAQLWESKFGIGSAPAAAAAAALVVATKPAALPKPAVASKPVVMSKPVILKSAPPPTAASKPKPTLAPKPKPPTAGSSPNPQQLIAQINNARSNGSSRGTFEDNFDPLAHSSKSQASTPRIGSSNGSLQANSFAAAGSGAHGGAARGISLTTTREVKGTRSAAEPPVSTFVTGQGQPVLPPKPPKQVSFANRPTPFPQHQGHALSPESLPAITTSSPLPLSPQLSSGSGSVGLQTPLTSVIHRSSAKVDNIPADALTRYSHLYKRLEKQHGKRGYLNADEVHAVVVRCRLPEDLLRRIWALSDRNLNGKFGPGEFNIIMHLADTALRQDPIPEVLSVDLLRSAYENRTN